ncbi:MAG: YebC/PmpR family DNA-binding transcriptional regulator [Candidatus Dojkabacteria bacterium]
MAGHSKWKNIQRTKQAQDKERAKNFTKLSKDITNAVKFGDSGDPQLNPLLKVAIDRAKALNMPNDRINRAIDKGLGKTSDDTLTYENTYEFYGPQNTTFVVDTETDNPNRTITDLKVLANKNNLKLADQGSISWQYNEVGEIVLLEQDQETPKVDFDTLILSIIEIEGIVDVQQSETRIIIICEKSKLKDITDKIGRIVKAANFSIYSVNIVKKAENFVNLNYSDEIQKIIDALLDFEEVINIWTNFDKSSYE